MIIKKISTTALCGILAVLAIGSCIKRSENFSDAELELIHGTDSIMRVLTVEDPADCFVLRASSSDLPAEALMSSDYRRLAELMVATVTHPSQDGVGIAGPQIGLNRRVIAVQRFDKEPVLRRDRLDYPFEVYPNVHIVWASDSLTAGPEGCLSVPGRRGDVLRSTEIVIEYADLESLAERCLDRLTGDESGTGKQTLSRGIPVRRDTISGFTAVIFQHEIDHLDGILYTDRL